MFDSRSMVVHGSTLEPLRLTKADGPLGLQSDLSSQPEHQATFTQRVNGDAMECVPA